MKLRNIVATAIVFALLAFVLALGCSSQNAEAATKINQTFTASVVGTSTTQPTNGVLTIYSDPLALHHTRSVEYYDHDGYFKTAILTASSRPYGVVLKEEDIENNCASYPGSLGTVNPVGGTGLPCHPVLHLTQPAPYPVTGDLLGRYCRVAPHGLPGTCPFAIHRTEIATGNGQYLTVGDIDHGALLKVEYYTWVGAQEYDITVKLPIPVLVTRIVLLPTTASIGPSAVLTLN